jgi:YfiR/HmsC-like
VASASAWVILSVVSIVAQSSAPTEYQNKAVFLSQFPNFIEWPDSAFSSVTSPFLICVFGDFKFGTSLAEATRSERFHGRKLEVRWLRKIPEVRACQILFVSRSEAARYGQVLAAVANTQILTVGETSDFLKAGGTVCFSFEKEALQFEVNLWAASGAGLKVSSRLLALAKRVVNLPEAAKG